jgi:CrcB protein
VGLPFATWQLWGLIAIAGAAGTLCRFGLSGIVQRWAGEGFAWGTLVVNALGCFLFALVWTLAEPRLLISGQTRFILLTGFMGAFTTFSTFAFETGQLMRDSQWALAAVNLAGQNLLGISCLFLGMAAGRLL